MSDSDSDSFLSSIPGEESRSGLPWMQNEENYVAERYSLGDSPNLIAQFVRRTPGAIIARLERRGLIRTAQVEIFVTQLSFRCMACRVAQDPGDGSLVWSEHQWPEGHTLLCQHCGAHLTLPAISWGALSEVQPAANTQPAHQLGLTGPDSRGALPEGGGDVPIRDRALRSVSESDRYEVDSGALGYSRELSAEDLDEVGIRVRPGDQPDDHAGRVGDKPRKGLSFDEVEQLLDGGWFER